MKGLHAKVALITGASSGIGEALAREYVRRGAKVAVAARRHQRLLDLAEDLESAGGEILPICLDVREEDAVKEAVNTVIERFGRLDHAIANAAFAVSGPFEKLTVDDYRRQFETNVFGVLHTAGAVRPALASSRGNLALIGSVNGYLALPGASPYCMSKFAVHALAASLYHELAAEGISVTLVAPGFVDSEIRRVDNRGQLHEEIAEPVPRWLRMRSELAARKILSAVVSRKRVAVITAHGRFAVLMERFSPSLLAWIVRRFGVRAGTTSVRET